MDISNTQNQNCIWHPKIVCWVWVHRYWVFFGYHTHTHTHTQNKKPFFLCIGLVYWVWVSYQYPSQLPNSHFFGYHTHTQYLIHNFLGIRYSFKFGYWVWVYTQTQIFLCANVWFREVSKLIIDIQRRRIFFTTTKNLSISRFVIKLNDKLC